MDKKQIYKKQYEILDQKITTDDQGEIYLSGYANTKGVADSYGDIPFNLNGEPVYDLDSRFKSNPIILIDHSYSVVSVVGKAVFGEDGTREDDRGLFVKIRLMNNPKTAETQHAIEVYKEGFARALSIGGKWIYNDPSNRNHLTTAIIHEISLVAIGADGQALLSTEGSKSAGKTENAKASRLDVLEHLIDEYRRTGDHALIECIKALRSKV